MFQRARGTQSTPLALQTNDTIGNFSFRGYDGTAFTGSQAYINSGASENWTATATGTFIDFRTTAN